MFSTAEAEKLRNLESVIGYTFRDRQLLFQALCHSSYANEHREEGAQDNERLPRTMSDWSFSGTVFLRYAAPIFSTGNTRRCRRVI